MKTVAFNRQNLLRKFTLLIAGFLILSNNAFAVVGTGGGEKGKKPSKALSADESTLLQTLENEHQQELKGLTIEQLVAPSYTKVLVYDLEGNLLQEQDSKVAKINLSKLPKNAKLLMMMNDLAIYLVM